jgi:hypothetical protein
MKFMLLLHRDESLPQPDTSQSDFAAFNDAMIKAGAAIGGARLRPISAATTIRVHDGRTQVLDGPYAETREQLGGYYLIEAADLDAATEWAARCPAAATGAVEIRPLWQPQSA